MNRDELLKARGWVRHGAGLDLWCPPGAPDGSWVDGDEASRVQVLSDRRHVVADGSVRFYPTAEQAQTSPLLAACAARGMCEREVIEELFIQAEQRRKQANACGEEGARAQAIAAAWKALARAEQATGAVGMSDRIAAARDRLGALGVDPDAADEPGSVAT